MLIFCFFLSCAREEKSYELTDDQFVQVLADLHFLEFIVNRKDPLPKDSIELLFFKDMEVVYGLPYEKIQDNIERLRSDAAKYNRIYVEVSKVLEDELNQNRSDEKSKLRKNDSEKR